MSVVLQIDNLTKVYGNCFALEDFSMTINENEILGIVGRNGSGKTTLLKTICRYVFPQEGIIQYQGNRLDRKPELIRDFGVILEPGFFDYFSAEENLKFLYHASCFQNYRSRKDTISTNLKMVGLYEERKQKVKGYTVLMKQKLAICQCMMSNPKLYVLDEPFTGLDDECSKMFRNFLLKRAHVEGVPVIITSNELDTIIDMCDRVIILEDGHKIADDLVVRECAYIYQIEKPLTEEAIKHIQRINNEIMIINDDILAFHNPMYEKKIKKCLRDYGLCIKDIYVQQNSLYNLYKTGSNYAI